MRLSGCIRTSEELWDLLINKRTTRSKVPPNLFNIARFYSQIEVAGTMPIDEVHSLSDDDPRDAFDIYFSMSKKEVEAIDPQQKMLLECRWRSWLGLANRVSYVLDFRGPSCTVRTASIHSGECDSAVVAGTNLIFFPELYLSMSSQGVLAKYGGCKTFDSTAVGFCHGQGIAAVYVKALKDCGTDTVRSVIRSTASNSLIRRAYRQAALGPSDTAYFVAHGTGIKTGDLIECEAISGLFDEAGGLFLGSIKPNLGHGEGVAGITSVIAASLALEHSTIPSNINFNKLKPTIAPNKATIEIPTEPAARPASYSRPVYVNSFGVGGSYCHRSFETLPFSSISP
ncbi:thiolase-like protein [Calycina marina]|uniref:Thiolase-like protein n=1 Tax=Calycina marina TaxID=1763456 RepID=A0A9P7YZS0_9HELO|nr:thiolase-like protein [Calycina marina]